MPINYARRLTGSQRTPAADRHLGYTLAFVAGAINAGGFLAVRQYTSHMTGIVSAMADDLAIGIHELALAGAGALLSFVAGAMCTAVLVNFGRRRAWQSVFALPLLLEAALLLLFGVVGASLSHVIGLFAVAVADEWQMKGLGTLLMQRLIAVARSRGIAKMHSSDAAENTSMRKFAKQLQFRHERDPEDATHVLYSVDLTVAAV